MGVCVARFVALCVREGVAPVPRFHALVRERFKGSLKPPFDHDARARAGLHEEWYMPLVSQPEAR